MPLPPAPTQRASLISSKTPTPKQSAVNPMSHNDATKKPIAKKVLAESHEEVRYATTAREPAPQPMPKKTKASKKNQGPYQTVRPRHQCAHARSHVPLSI